MNSGIRPKNILAVWRRFADTGRASSGVSSGSSSSCGVGESNRRGVVDVVTAGRARVEVIETSFRPTAASSLRTA